MRGRKPQYEVLCCLPRNTAAQIKYACILPPVSCILLPSVRIESLQKEILRFAFWAAGCCRHRSPCCVLCILPQSRNFLLQSRNLFRLFLQHHGFIYPQRRQLALHACLVDILRQFFADYFRMSLSQLLPLGKVVAGRNPPVSFADIPL